MSFSGNKSHTKSMSMTTMMITLFKNMFYLVVLSSTLHGPGPEKMMSMTPFITATVAATTPTTVSCSSYSRSLTDLVCPWLCYLCKPNTKEGLNEQQSTSSTSSSKALTDFGEFQKAVKQGECAYFLIKMMLMTLSTFFTVFSTASSKTNFVVTEFGLVMGMIMLHKGCGSCCGNSVHRFDKFIKDTKQIEGDEGASSFANFQRTWIPCKTKVSMSLVCSLIGSVLTTVWMWFAYCVSGEEFNPLALPGLGSGIVDVCVPWKTEKFDPLIAIYEILLYTTTGCTALALVTPNAWSTSTAILESKLAHAEKEKLNPEKQEEFETEHSKSLRSVSQIAKDRQQFILLGQAAGGAIATVLGGLFFACQIKGWFGWSNDGHMVEIDDNDPTRKTLDACSGMTLMTIFGVVQVVLNGIAYYKFDQVDVDVADFKSAVTLKLNAVEFEAHVKDVLRGPYGEQVEIEGISDELPGKLTCKNFCSNNLQLNNAEYTNSENKTIVVETVHIEGAVKGVEQEQWWLIVEAQGQEVGKIQFSNQIQGSKNASYNHILDDAPSGGEEADVVPQTAHHASSKPTGSRSLACFLPAFQFLFSIATGVMGMIALVDAKNWLGVPDDAVTNSPWCYWAVASMVGLCAQTAAPFGGLASCGWASKTSNIGCTEFNSNTVKERQQSCSKIGCASVFLAASGFFMAHAEEWLPNNDEHPLLRGFVACGILSVPFGLLYHIYGMAFVMQKNDDKVLASDKGHVDNDMLMQKTCCLEVVSNLGLGFGGLLAAMGDEALAGSACLMAACGVYGCCMMNRADSCMKSEKYQWYDRVTGYCCCEEEWSCCSKTWWCGGDVDDREK